MVLKSTHFTPSLRKTSPSLFPPSFTKSLPGCSQHHGTIQPAMIAAPHDKLHKECVKHIQTFVATSEERSGSVQEIRLIFPYRFFILRYALKVK